jgi:hypothetical protein
MVYLLFITTAVKTSNPTRKTLPKKEYKDITIYGLEEMPLPRIQSD